MFAAKLLRRPARSPPEVLPIRRTLSLENLRVRQQRLREGQEERAVRSPGASGTVAQQRAGSREPTPSHDAGTNTALQKNSRERTSLPWVVFPPFPSFL